MKYKSIEEAETIEQVDTKENKSVLKETLETYIHLAKIAIESAENALLEFLNENDS